MITIDLPSISGSANNPAQNFSNTKTYLNDLAAKINYNSSETENRLIENENTVNQMQEEVMSVFKKFSRINERVTALEHRMDEAEKNIEYCLTQIDALWRAVNSLRS